MLEKIANLLKTGTRSNIELAYQLSLSTKTSLWPLERGIKDLLYHAHTQPSIAFDNLPLGQLCYLLNNVIALSITEKSLTQIPEQLYFCPALVILEIVDTPLIELPASIGELAQLKSLTLKNTAIEQLPASIAQLSKLETINLMGNPNLKDFPMVLLQLSNLKTVRVDASIEIPAMDCSFELIVMDGAI